MKSHLCLSLVVAFSLVSGDLFAGTEELSPAANSKQSDAAGISFPEDGAAPASSKLMIPGPLRSFLRMAGISQKITPEEVLPLLSWNVFTQGYDRSKQSEFLILLSRYVVQARELSALAATSGMIIRVSNCDDAKPLLRILGYQTRPNCGGPDTSLQTAHPERAFLTIDSGFPLPELEQTLQGGKPFEYPFPPSPVPVLFGANDWTIASKNDKRARKDLINTILSDPSVARLYWALSKLDPETNNFLQRSVGLKKLLPYAAVLDFYGSHICIHAGRIVVPGGPNSESAWKDLVGASADSPATFVQRLLARDRGWLAAYFDVLSRVSRSQQAYFTERHRLRPFYDALRGTDPSAGATTGVFRPDPALLLLVTRLQREPSGEALVPGSLEVWNDILRQNNDSRIMREWGRDNTHLTGPDQLVQAMFALSRAKTDCGPLQIYLATSEIESKRSPEHRLAPATVRLLARKFAEFGDQYPIFSEFPELSGASLALFLETAEALNKLPDPVRGNALGTFQATVGIWQILARQGQISNRQLDDSWQQVIKSFAGIRSAAQSYDAGRASLGELFRFATGKREGSQDEIIELLAGPRQTTPEGKRIHQELANKIRFVLDDQRLISLDTLLALGDALSEQSQGGSQNEFAIHLAAQLREFEMPRPIFSSGERTEWAPRIYNTQHVDAEMRTDLTKVLRSRTASHAQLEEARGQLASFLRDALVGLNYAYYEPPGAQALHHNPLFVRCHDFAGETIIGMKTVWQTPQLFGQGYPAGGGAHFVGSLADLPYVLAEIEQDFISPQSVQALILTEVTPVLLTSAILPRWWDVSQNELHAVTLYQRTGEELLAASVTDQELRNKVITILSDRMIPQWTELVEQGLRAGHVSEILPRMTPADTFYLTAEFQRRYPREIGSWGSAAQELQDLSRQHPEQVSWSRLSRDFGVPHRSLAQTYGRELLNIEPMPAVSGYASRLLAESWDSTNLYWARLADETGNSAVALNHLVPYLTRHMIEKIFATDLEDWPALLRAMHETGEDFREGKIDSLMNSSAPRP